MEVMQCVQRINDSHNFICSLLVTHLAGSGVCNDHHVHLDWQHISDVPAIQRAFPKSCKSGFWQQHEHYSTRTLFSFFSLHQNTFLISTVMIRSIVHPPCHLLAISDFVSISYAQKIFRPSTSDASHLTAPAPPYQDFGRTRISMSEITTQQANTHLVA